MKEHKGCLIGCLAILAGMGLVVAGFIFVLIPMVVGLANQVQGKCASMTAEVAESDTKFEKIWVSGKGNEDSPKILKVQITGTISEGEKDIFGEEKSSAVSALRKIRAATVDHEICGLYLVLDTPGGEVTLSDIIANAVKRFKAQKEGRFVLVQMGACCCSGGYYIAAGADYIIAHPTTITGSIGVIFETFNAAELAKKIGIESVVIATGENKSLLNPLRPVEGKHLDIFTEVVRVSYERFLNVVSEGRKMPVSKIRPIADGRIFSANDAKELGLIDAIGYSEDAELKLAEMAKADKIRVYRYEDELLFSDFFNGLFVSVEGMTKVLMNMVDKRPGLK